MTDGGLEQLVRRLDDHRAITQLIYQYCRSMDRIDVELGRQVWHDDGIADYPGIFDGLGRDFVAWVADVHRNAVATSHQVTNILLTIDGDRASSESYVTAVLRFRDDGRLMQTTVRGRYLDSWSRRADRWGIDKRVNVIDFDDVAQVTATGMGTGGRPDRDDPSYGLPSYTESRI